MPWTLAKSVASQWKSSITAILWSGHSGQASVQTTPKTSSRQVYMHFNETSDYLVCNARVVSVIGQGTLKCLGTLTILESSRLDDETAC